MTVFFGRWQHDDIGCRPQPDSVLVGDEFSSEASARARVSGFEMNCPTTVELVVTVHRPAAAEANQHGFCTTGHAQDFMAKN